MNDQYQIVAKGYDSHVLSKEEALYLAVEIGDVSGQKVTQSPDTIYINNKAYARLTETVVVRHIFGRWTAYKANLITGENTHAAFADTRQGAVDALERQLQTIAKYQ